MILCCAISSLTVTVNAQTSSVVWSKRYGYKGYESAEAVVETSDGGFAIAGWIWSPTGMMLVKTDKSGIMEWIKTYAISDFDRAMALTETSDGGYALAGYARPFESRGHDFWLVKTDADGNMEWNQLYGGLGAERAEAIIETSDGGFALAGGGLLVKTDESGVMEWDQTYGMSIHSLIVTSDGGYVLFGLIGLEFFEYEQCLIKTDSNGTMEWNQTYNVVDLSHASAACVEASDGGFLLASGGLIAKTDEFGNMEWNKTCPATSLLVKASDGGYVLAGGYLLVKTDVNGNIEWNQTYGGAERHSIASLAAISDGGYVLAGYYGNHDQLGQADFWLIKTDERGYIPEFPSWIILPLVLTITLFSVIIKRNIKGV